MYDLGPASRDLGLEALRRVDPARIAAAYSVDLRNETGHTAEVAVWSSAGPILIAWDPGAHELPVLVRVGSTLPLLDSAVGSVFLAYLPESMTSEALVQQQQRGATRRISAREAKKMKAETLADGYGHTSNRMVLGLASLAAPVFNADRRLECVLGLDLPARMMTTKEMKRLGRLLRATADQATGQPHFTG
jgi:DNA-binding IclR family transcriptional regulator